jgi:hypothetical protein
MIGAEYFKKEFVTTISREKTAWEGILMSSCERDADALYCPSSI